MSSLLRMRRDHRRQDSAMSGQFDPDSGRNLSDMTHPEYDPATDPELRKSAANDMPGNAKTRDNRRRVRSE